MSASDKLNEIAKIRRSQGHKDRAFFVSTRDAVKGNKLAYCGTWLYLREWMESGESKVLNALLCKLPFLCEVCAVRRQAKMFAASVPKVKHVMQQRPELQPFMLTFGVKTGPDLAEQFDHFAESRKRYMDASRRSKSSSCRNGQMEMAKVSGQIRSWEIKRAKGDSNHWNVHQHAFVLAPEDLDQWKISDEWRHFSGDSFIVDVTPIEAKNEESDPVESGLLEVIKYPLKFAGLTAEDAWLAHETLSGRRMTDTLGILRGINPGSIDHDDGIEEMTGPFRDFVARWQWERQAFEMREVQRFELNAKPGMTSACPSSGGS